jgi:hypothetical protein
MSSARERQALRWVLVGDISLLLLCLGAWVVFRGTADDGGGSGSARLGESSASFTIDGDAVAPISPGVRAPLDLKFTNRQDVPLTVTRLRVTVQRVSAPNADKAHPCAARDFVVDQASSGLEITLARRSTSVLSRLGVSPADQPHVGMVNRAANQDGCKGASVTLAYTASGRTGA